MIKDRLGFSLVSVLVASSVGIVVIGKIGDSIYRRELDQKFLR